jgi:glutamate--cysteine ligase
MSRDLPQSEVILESKDQLVAYFAEGIKPLQARRVGTEHEKFIFWRDTLQRAPYEGERGIGRIFELLAERYNYTLGLDGENPVAAERKNAAGFTEAITIEPGGQFELSGAPVVFIDETEAELDLHMREVCEICRELDLLPVGMGVDPLHSLGEVAWMPKSRYRIMRDYMTRVGNLGHWMMKMTCTAQANFDYTSEEDAADILRTALWVSPIISAMFARSPIWQGKPSGFMSVRNHIWTDTDDQRCGFPLFMLQGDFGFAEYVEYTLDVPMYLIRRGKQYINMAGHSFRDFMRDGHQGHRATMGDYELHLSTIFPEVRMKRYIEVRGADVGPRSHILALPALWKGLLYDPQARRQARELVTDFSLEERGALFDHAVRWSLKGPVPGRQDQTLGDLARTLIQLSSEGLDRMETLETPLARNQERRYLQPLLDDLDREQGSAAHAMLERWHQLGGDTRAWTLEHEMKG